MRFLYAIHDLHEAARAQDKELARELERILALPAVPMEIANDRRAVERYWRAMKAAEAADIGQPVRDIAASLGVSVTTVRRDLRYLERFDLPDWLRSRQKGRHPGA